MCVWTLSFSFFLSVNSIAESPKSNLLVEARRRGEFTWSVLAFSASHSYMRRRRRSVFRIVFSANASDISACERCLNCESRPSKIARERKSESEKERVQNVSRIERSRSARSERIDTPPRGTRVPLSRAAPRCASKDCGRKFSNSGPSFRLTCFRRRATDSNAAIATQSNDAGRSRPPVNRR